jgi:translation initiation factor 5A
MLSFTSARRKHGLTFIHQVNIDDGFLNLMTQDGAAKDDVKLPEGDLGKQIEEGFEEGKDLLVTIVAAMGEEAAISSKEAPKGT